MIVASAGQRWSLPTGIVDVSAATASPVPTMPGEVMEPVGFSPFWLVTGVSLLAIVALFYLLVWWFTRIRRPPAPVQPATTYDPQRYLMQVDEVAKRVHLGTMTPRDGYLELSRIVRAAVCEYTGIPADKMTLDDLRRSPLRHTSEAIGFVYPGVFGPEPRYDYARALQLAREVLAGWN